MNTGKIIRVRDAGKPKPKSERVANCIPEVEQPEQPAIMEQVESLAELIRSESLYGSGWSFAELVNEFEQTLTISSTDDFSSSSVYNYL